MNWLAVDNFLKEALKEDFKYGDITTESIISNDSKCSVDLIAKEEGIVAGLEVFRRVFTLLQEVEVEFKIKDGDRVKKADIIGKVIGNTQKVLAGERVALNMLQRMSGIATITNSFVKELEGTNTKILDTRKTTPNLRIFEKYAVKIGGGFNHRFNLSDGILIKDNHISAAGGIKNAVNLVKSNASFVRKLEVEVETIDQVYEAIEAKADIIMLDNMEVEVMRKAVEIINGQAITEASGNVTLEKLREIGETGVDYISSGAITHSVKAFDISMKNLVLLQ